MSDMKDRVMQVILAEADVEKGFIPDHAKNKFSDNSGNLKCPFCQQELTQITTSNPLGLGRIEMAVCKKCMDKGVLHIMPIWDWQELIRTRKALDKAKWWLKEIVESHRCTPISTAEMALEDITALEQKNHFANANKKVEQKE